MRNVTMTIPSGDSVSGVLALNGDSPVAFHAPSAWTTAAMQIEATINGTDWITVINDEVGSTTGNYSALTANAGYAVDFKSFLGYRGIRLRSGSAGSPVNQAADRVFTVSVRYFQ